MWRDSWIRCLSILEGTVAAKIEPGVENRSRLKTLYALLQTTPIKLYISVKQISFALFVFRTGLKAHRSKAKKSNCNLVFLGGGSGFGLLVLPCAVSNPYIPIFCDKVHRFLNRITTPYVPVMYRTALTFCCKQSQKDLESRLLRIIHRLALPQIILTFQRLRT